jgi:hypothetical protein
MALSFVKGPRTLTEILEAGASLRIGPDLAGRILSECHYQGQRKLEEERAMLHAERIEHGTFLENSQIAFGLLDGRLYLVNGRHRMHAIGLAQMPYAFRIEIYPCRTRADLDALYCRFDQPGSNRSLAQVSSALGLHDDHEGGLRPPMAALLLRAVPLLMIELKRVPPCHRPRATRDLDAKKEFALAWKPAAIDYQACLDLGATMRTGRFRNAGVVAVALATLRHQRDKAFAFWAGAIRNDGLPAGDPRQTLCNDFMVRGRTSHEFDLAEASAAAWNAFMQGRPLKITKVCGSPIRLAGTPYQGDEQ